MTLFRAASLIALAALGCGGLSACHDHISAAAAPDGQVCYRFLQGEAGKRTLLSAPDENLETCAMHLEGWRMMHGLASVNGTYQGQYVFASTQGIVSAADARSTRYRVYTPGQQADLDQKLQTLIARQANTTGDNTTGENKTGD